MTLVVTPKSSSANSYVSMARAKQILRARLNTTPWDDAAETPDAEDYQSAASGSPGASTLAIDTGSGTFTVGCVFTFASHATEYTVQTALTGAGTLSFSPVLAEAVADNEAITRLTNSTRERALMWATKLLDDLMDWYGAPRELDQALKWPRSGVRDRDGEHYDYDTIPVIIEEATAYLAVDLLDRDRFKTPDLIGQGIEEAKVGSLSVKVSRAAVDEVVSDNIRAMIGHLGEVIPSGAKGLSIVKLRRG